LRTTLNLELGTILYASRQSMTSDYSASFNEFVRLFTFITLIKYISSKKSGNWFKYDC